ncbi:MAG: DUF418 domain-containing protein [Pseudomonadota bacterium]|nr:DUF418 domain-containing protein [Pseudomonadota bacterium]
MATIAAGLDHSAAPAAAAAPATERFEALDFVRGAALFGILLMNITGFGLPHAYANPTVWGGAEGANLWAWIITTIGFEGTQRGLFSMLFGAGIILLTSRLDAAGRTDTADIYMRRNLWLVAFGIANAYILLWGGDILFFYGVTALFLFAFRKLSARLLLILGLAALLANLAWNAKDAQATLSMQAAYERAVAAREAGTGLSDEQTGAIEAWEERIGMFAPPAAQLQAEVRDRTAGYFSAMAQQAAQNVQMIPFMLYRYFFDVFGMMLIGMALFKYGVLTLQRPTRLYLAMAAAGYGVGLAVNLYELELVMGSGFTAAGFARADVTYDVGRLAMTMGHLAALMLFVRSGAIAWFRRALAAVGRMAFTNYLAHSLICLILFVGFGLYGQLERHQLYFVVFAIWAAQLAISPIWLRHYRFGPLEWLWRYLTYLKRPPLRHTAVPITAAAAA